MMKTLTLTALTAVVLALPVMPAQAESVGQRLDQTIDKTRELGGKAWDSTREGAASLMESGSDKAGEVWDKTRSGAAEAVEAGSETAGEAWDATKEGVGGLWDKVKSKASEMTE